MQTKNQISPARKFLYGFMLLGIVFSIIGTGDLPNVSAQEIETPTSTTDEEIRLAILGAIKSHDEVLGFIVFDVLVEKIEVSTDRTWTIVSLYFIDKESSTIVPSEPGLALGKKINGEWQITLQSDSKWNEVLENIPDHLLSDDEKAFWYIEPSDVMAQQTFGGYKLPWAGGQSHALYRSITHSFSAEYYAFDFGENGNQFELRASKGGVIWFAQWTYPDGYDDGNCNNANYIVIKDTSTSPETFVIYLHLKQNSIPNELRTRGVAVSQGQLIGIADDTGCSSASHVHIHAHTNPNSWYGTSQDITFDDVSINGGRPRTPAEASAFGGQGQTWYTSGNYGGGGANNCQNTGGSGIRLYDGINCTGTEKYFSSTGFTNMPDIGFNDMASSINIGDGWSVRVYEHDNRGGSSRCIAGDMWDLSVDYYTSGNTGKVINNDISSIDVYNNTSCTSTGTNWNAKYFNGHDHWWDNNNFNNQMCEQNISSTYLDRNYGSGAPCNNGISDNWVAEYNATVNFQSGSYVFYAQNDDGLKIWVNGSNIMERGGSSGYYPRCPALNLSGNVPIRAILREEGGDARVKITWSTDTSVCIPPGSFNKSSPSSNATGVSTSPTLIWGSSSNATGYHYCIDTSNNNNCDAGWQNNGTSTSKGLSGLTAGTTYYWQARANNEGGEVFANGGTWWSFTTQSISTDGASFISQSVYPTVTPGSSLQIFFTVKNTGNTTWQPGSYWLQNLQYPLGATSQQSLSQSVSPNGTYTWTINQTAPNTPGTYRSQWMISHNGTTFGPNMFIDVTVQSATINLLSNGGFENGSSSPTSWSQDAWQSTYSAFVWDTAQKHLGNKSVKIVNNTANDARWIQTVSVAPNTDYRLSGWIKTQDVQNIVDRGANLSILDTWITTTKLKGTNDWTYVSVDFNSEAMTSVRVAARLGMYSGEIGGTAWFDDLKLEPLNVTIYTVFLPYVVRP